MSPSDDQTSAALYNGVRRVLEGMGIVDPGASSVHGEARAPHGPKRDLLEIALDQGGPDLILRLGAELMGARSDPSVTVLRRAIDPPDALRRWQRLERFYHSRHRTEILEEAPGKLRARHVATRGAAPAPVDDLLIAGIAHALIEASGARNLRARFGDEVPFWGDDGPCLAAIEDTAESATWCFEWSEVERALPASTRSPVRDPEALEARLRAEIATDPARAWTVEALAKRCGLSKRTLQRRLEALGTNARSLLRELRGRHAAALLAETDIPLAQVGFASGYADQAHFSREFKRCIGMPPGRYREML